MTNKTNLVKCLHTAALNPVKSTWIRVIKKGNLQSWPGLTVKLVTKYLPNSVTTSNIYIYISSEKNMRSPKLIDE